MIDLHFDKIKINPRELTEKTAALLARRSQLILGLLAVLLMAYGAYLWYAFITNPRWSDEQKQAYASTKQNSAAFNQKGFDAALNEINNRKNEYNNQLANVPDVFGLK